MQDVVLCDNLVDTFDCETQRYNECFLVWPILLISCYFFWSCVSGLKIQCRSLMCCLIRGRMEVEGI